MMPRSFQRDTERIAHGGLTIATVAIQPAELQRMKLSLEQFNNCRLMAYERPEQLFASIPVGPVDLLVISSQISPESLKRITRWSRRHWPRCLSVVIDAGCDVASERMARQNGAMFFNSPVVEPQWQAILESAAAGRSVRLKTA
jgi:hypothetical protein